MNRSIVTRTLRGWFPDAKVRELRIHGVPMLEASTSRGVLARVEASRGYAALVEALLPWLAHQARRGQIRVRGLNLDSLNSSGVAYVA